MFNTITMSLLVAILLSLLYNTVSGKLQQTTTALKVTTHQQIKLLYVNDMYTIHSKIIVN